MQTVTIKGAQDMVGQVIPRLEAKVLNVYDRKTGTGQYGHWSLQNAEIEDASGKMKVVFSKMPCQSRLKGRTVVFKSMLGKHGLKGVEAKENDYNGKKTVELKVSSAALVCGGDEEAQVSEATPSTRMPSNTPIMPSEALPRQEVKSGMAMVKNRLTQLAGLYDLCWKTANSMELEKEFSETSDLKDVASCLFIQSIREGLADKMPIRTTDKFFGDKIKPGYRGEPDEDPEGPDLDSDDIPF